MFKTLAAAAMFCAFATVAYAATPQPAVHNGPTKLTNAAMAQVNGGSALEGFGDILEGVHDTTMGYVHEGTRDILEGTRDIVHAALH